MGAKPTRRQLLGAIGAGAAAAAIPGVAGAEPADQQLQQEPPAQGPGTFSRMFPGLAPFADASDDVLAALAGVGAAGGPMDPGGNPRDNPRIPAGHTFLGQFIDHDLTFDAGSTLGVPATPETSMNLRTARFDLDNVYGGGPAASPSLYEPDGSGRFRVESGGLFEDLPRTGDGTAIIADGRDDENLIIGGLHCAFLLFHNAVLDQLGGDFDAARREVTWHYQWMVLNEILPMFVGDTIADDVRSTGRQWFTPAVPSIPVEFQVAAYRFGHALVRTVYDAHHEFSAPVFAPGDDLGDDPNDLRGGERAERRWVDWSRFFDFGLPAQMSRRLDATIAAPLLNLPARTIDAARGAEVGPRSLATRNLQRHLTWGIPSGQAIAAAMGVAPTGPSNFADLSPWGLDQSTPLWFYILREADRHANGAHLGPVGGRIVAEVFLGLLELDPDSWINADPTWQPSLGSNGDFTITDLLRVAGVDPATRALAAPTDIAVAVSCLNNDGRFDITLRNPNPAATTYSTRVGRVGPRVRLVPEGGTGSITVTGRRDGNELVVVERDGVEVLRDAYTVRCDPAIEAAIVTSCAAGRGRFDISLENTTASRAVYAVNIPGLAPRTRTLDPGNRSTVIVTGRPSRDYEITVTRNGTEVLRQIETVQCSPLPDDEVTVATSCLGGNGRVDIELFNDSDVAATYTIVFGALVPRQRTVAARSQSTETITGRPDGNWPLVVQRDDQTVFAELVAIDCDS